MMCSGNAEGYWNEKYSNEAWSTVRIGQTHEDITEIMMNRGEF